MPFDPTEVRSRDELLMGAIATGDSSVIGDPRDRTEEFIKAIADGIGGAGKSIYRHNVLCKYIMGGSNSFIIFDVLNHSATPIETVEDMVENFPNVVEFHLSTGGPGSYLMWVFEKATKVGGTTIRIKIRYATQDPDTKIISQDSENSDLVTVQHDDVIEI